MVRRSRSERVLGGLGQQKAELGCVRMGGSAARRGPGASLDLARSGKSCLTQDSGSISHKNKQIQIEAKL